MLLEAPLVVGLILSLSLAAPPGPANALMAQETARRGFWSGWWTGMGAVMGDLTMLALTLFGTLKLLELVPNLSIALAFLGAGLMGKFAWDAWAAARRPGLPDAKGGAGFFRNYIIVITSPFNLAWWLTAGPSLIGRLGWQGVVGFYLGLLIWVFAWNGLALAGARRIARFAHWVGYGSAAVLAAFAVLLLVFAVTSASSLLMG